MGGVAELGLDIGKLAAAHAGAGRVAALGHEAGNDAVEHHAVIESITGKTGNPLDMAGRQVGAQPDDDVAATRKIKGQGLGVGHHANPR